MAIDLSTILDPAVLRRVWKDVRSRERKVHLTEIPLVRDSTGGIAFEMNFGDVLTNLRLRLFDGTYRPHSPMIVESAKSKLLRRRLSFLSFEDALILGSLVQATRYALMTKAPEWVSFGQADHDKKTSNKKNQRIITVDYEGWWNKWLRYRKLLKVIEDDPNPLLVISDITNFFGSIDISLLRSKVSGTTSLDTEANNLLFYLLEGLRPAESYSPQGVFGLPTVPDDTSRIMAHFYLGELDNELLEEGRRDRYTRWVDDMVISVPNELEGGKVVARVERALSRLGLVANSSKTSLVTKEEFRKQHFEDANEYLDHVHKMTENDGQLTPEDLIEFEDRLSGFLESQSFGNWSRVLQRYYTESRRVRSTTLLKNWDGHLTEFPIHSRHILDYVAFFPGSLEFCEQLFAFLKREGPLFEDIQILAYEAILLKPFPQDSSVRDYIVRQTHCHFLGQDGFEVPSGYVKGLQALTMYKFGWSEVANLIEPSYGDAILDSPSFATYALPVLATSDQHRSRAFERTEQIEDSRILRIRALVERLESGDDRATGILLGFLQPKKTVSPNRWLINSRVLPLLKIARRSSVVKNAKRIRVAMEQNCEKVSSLSDQSLVDWVAVEHLKLEGDHDKEEINVKVV